MRKMVMGIGIKKTLLALGDAILLNFSFFFITYMYFDSNPPPDIVGALIGRSLYVTISFLILFWGFGLYNSIWKYAGFNEVIQSVIAVAVGSVASVGIDKAGNYLELSNMVNFPPLVYFSSMMLNILLISSLRLSYRALRRYVNSEKGLLKKSIRGKRIMIIGAGDMGMIIFKDLDTQGYRRGKPVIFVDDKKGKQGRTLCGVPVRGGCEKIPELVNKYKVDEIIFAIPSATNERKSQIMQIAMKTKCTLKTAASLSELANFKPGIQKVRKVEISDLLSRPEVTLDTQICKYLKGQTVLVTGGGGSIGSEICRQVAKYGPSTIIIFDIYENNAFYLKNSIDYEYEGFPDVQIRIGSVQDEKRLREVFEEFRPSVVFHAAAHKHVPLMEENPCEAIKNNIFGTYNTATVARDYAVKNFVILSTDKAVNPANVMGATKRVTELIVQYFDSISPKTKFAAVRFGNVLGSNGSVIPIFKEQIERGGPVTVTDANITRFFMTIPEAAQLVVQAGGLSKGGEVFVLDMGEPVKILELAENIIRLSGYEPYTDIEIAFTGLRPGEKLYEELSLNEEVTKKMTANNKIFVTAPIDFNHELLLKTLDDMRVAAQDNVRSLLKKIVPNYVQHNGNDN
ncbi:MAG TPA: nucleoside-diphosphate sugar epimerase/dehydratase [Clostridia bacterium]|nr:nucleoside-diphosphate sugar epimerase/dehydratase [Clostridia bacterium]